MQHNKNVVNSGVPAGMVLSSGAAVKGEQESSGPNGFARNMINSAEQLQIVFETVSDSIVTFDQDTGILFANPATQKIFGHTPAELAGKKITVLLPEYHLLLHTSGISWGADGGEHNLVWNAVRLAGVHRHGYEISLEVTLSTFLIDGKRLFTGVLRDISDRARAAEQLRDSENRYRQLFERNLAGVYRSSLEGRILDCNPAFVRMCGCRSREEVLALQTLDFYPTLEHRKAFLDELKRNGSVVNREALYHRKDRTPIWILENASLIPGADDQEAVIEGTILDVTARRRVEEELEAQRLFLRQVIDINPHLIFAKDREGRYTLANRTVADAFNTSSEQIVGKTDADLNPNQSEVEHFRKYDLQVMDTRRESFIPEERMTFADKQTHWLETVKRPILDADGVCNQVLGVSTDITEQRYAQEALRESERRYRELVDNAIHGIYRTSNDGKFADANPALVEMLGYASREELLNVDIAQSVAIDPAAYSAMIDDFEKAGHIEGYEVTWKRKDGALANLRLSGKRISVSDGASESFEVIAENITERRMLEQQLLHAQKMEAVGRLAGGIAHDFNNLLGVIIGYSEMMLEKFRPGDPLQKYGQEVRKAADRAAGLTRQLLAFSRKQVLEPKVLDLNTIVTEVEKLLHRLIGEDIEVIVSLAPELQRVKADPGQIEQVIMNLAVNARDAMPKGGKLFLKTSNVVFDDAFVEQHLGSTAGCYAMLTISDTGAGMDAETRLRIFEPFFTTKERGKGTGLGLATVYGIVKQSGGYITVYSEPGHGSTFKIWLPAVDDVVVAPATDGRRQETLTGTETILVAEDADQLRELVRGLLEISGYQVLEARSPDEAINLVRGSQAKIDLLLTDVVMPGMSGLDLAERFVGLSPETRVLFMSGYADDVISGRGVPQTDANLLQKPFTRQSLLRKVRESLSKPGEKHKT